jgi:RNA polymerase sigma factor (sigma-70 family)
MATAAPEIPVLARDLAFERLYRQYVKDVYHYALALLRNPADAEDVTQTTFMNAYRAFKRGEEPRKPQNWLIKIAHNAARTRYARSTRRVKEVPLDDHVDALAVPDDEKPDVAAVLEALGQLPLNQRAALVMRELEGRSYGEIAETLNVSVPAVETLIFRARRSLRMKASSIRSLAAVPVPPSLLQLFGGGGNVAAGGSAAIGSGFLLKAAVVVVAGAVATSVVGGNRTPSADAASSSRALPAPAWRLPAAAFKGTLALRAKRSAARSNHVRRSGGTIATQRGRLAGADPGELAASPVGGVDVGASPSARPQTSSAPSSAVQQVTTTVASVHVTVPPVSVAALPPTPSAPSLPAVPSLPTVPSVPAPAPPALPKLP